VTRRRLQNQQPAYPAGSAALAETIDRELTHAAPWIPLFTPTIANLTSTRVGNYHEQDGTVVLDQLWIK
jgi:hypothetical protein